MNLRDKRIAILSPVAWRTPPRTYGAWETVASNIAEGLGGVCDRWILQPEDPWEVVVYVHNVVFTCGAIPEPDGTLKLYWGGADKAMCAGTAIIAELVDACLTFSRPAM